jgi:hypothetical protein
VEDVSACLWYNEPETTGGLLENLEIVGGYYYAIKFETNWDWDNSVPFAQRRGVSNVTVRNCNIHHSGRDAIKLTPACANILIDNCEIHHTGVGPGAQFDFNAEGIDNVNAPNLTVRGCHIHDVATTGVYVKGGGRNCLIEGNLIENCGEGGIYLGFYTDAEWFDTDFNPQYFENIDGLVVNNIVIGTQHAGIGLWGAKNARVFHNTVVNAAQAEHAALFFNTTDVWIDDNNSAQVGSQNVQVQNNIFVQSAAQTLAIARVREGALSGTNLIDHNCYFDPNGALFIDDGLTWEDLSLSQWQAQSGRDAHSLGSNPLLDASGHLQAGSPCIGQAAVLNSVTKDFDGGPRDGQPDLGADEFGATSNTYGPSANTDLQISLLGNPAVGDFLQFQISSTRQRSTTLQILTLNGQVLHHETFELTLGEQTLSRPIAQLPTGTYWLTVGGSTTAFVRQ